MTTQKAAPTGDAALARTIAREVAKRVVGRRRWSSAC
jgi:hypothetical protein